MPTAFINQTDARVHLTGNRLEVFAKITGSGADELFREIPIRDLDRLILMETVQITSQALAAMLRANIPVNILDWNGRFLGGFLPAHNAHGEARLRQYRKTLDAQFALQLSGRILTAKLYNQRRILQRLIASRADEAIDSSAAPPPETLPLSGIVPTQHPGDRSIAIQSASPSPPPVELLKSDIQNALQWLDNLFASITRSTSLDELRGYEGAGTARYFQAWARFLPAPFPFERRSTRPPLNPVNACISFGSTLLYTEAVAFVHVHGLDPALGLLHKTEDGRWSLALDLIEPFRPVLVEALALDLFSHQILSPDHFEPKNGGIYLNDEGRKKFILQYERRMERQFMSEAVGHRTTLRQQLEQQAVMFKAALENAAKFEPFLVN